MFKILLIEDNAADVMLVREALRTSPISAELIIASDGEQAMKFLLEMGLKPDCILLDLNIPKSDGFTVLERYRVEGGAPVVVLTSSNNPANIHRALDLGARDYLVKPAELDPFMRTVRGIFERWGAAAA